MANDGIAQALAGVAHAQGQAAHVLLFFCEDITQFKSQGSRQMSNEERLDEAAYLFIIFNGSLR